MTIPVQQFQILSPEQANPLGRGMLTGAEIYRNFVTNKYLPEQLQQQARQRELANQTSELNLRDLPDYLKARLSGMNLANQGQSISNQTDQLKLSDLPRELQVKYLQNVLANQGQSLSNDKMQINNQSLPARNQASLENTQLLNKQIGINNEYLPQKNENDILHTYLGNRRETIEQEHLPEKLAQERLQQDLANGILNIQRKYAEPNAQANLESTQLQNRFLPLDNLIKAQQAAQSSSRFGSAYQLNKTLQSMSPAARNIYIAHHQDEYNQMLSDMNAKDNPNYITPDILKQYFPQIGNNISQGQQPSSINKGGFRQSTPEEIAQTRLASEMSANKGLTTAATQRQLEGAIQVEGIMNSPEFQSQAQNAATYAGAMGKGKAALDALSQNNPKAYEDYLAFKNQTLVLLENRIKTLDQMGATNAQRQELKGLYDKTADSLTSNPKQFMTQLNNLGKTLNMVARSVQSSASPLTQQNRIGDYKEMPENQVNTKTINGKTYYRIGNTNEWNDGK